MLPLKENGLRNLHTVTQVDEIVDRSRLIQSSLANAVKKKYRNN